MPGDQSMVEVDDLLRFELGVDGELCGIPGDILSATLLVEGMSMGGYRTSLIFRSSIRVSPV